jgi:alpha-1,6-mannosyltransferase
MNPEKPEYKHPDGIKQYPIHVGMVGMGVISGIVYLLNFKLDKFIPDFLSKTDIHLYLFLFMFLAALYFFGIYIILSHLAQIGRSKILVVIIICFAVFFRAFLIPTNPNVLSKDIYRYIWDGRVQQHGINPYLYPPSSDQLKSLREHEVYPNINRKDYPTIYPAGAQLMFRIFHTLVGDRVYGFKALMALFDMITVLLLLALLKVYGYEETRVFIYAWNPLVIFEIANSGHLEGFTVFLIVLAFYLNAKMWKLPAVIILAFSAATKLYPALLLPALLNRGERIKGMIAFTVPFFMFYIPFLTAGNKVAGFLPVYFKNPYESFNLGFKYMIMQVFPGLNYFYLSIVFILVLAAIGLFILFREKRKEQAVHCAFILIGFLIILMPASLQPWYVIIMIPFLTFFPSVPWLIFTGTVALSYLKYVSPTGIMPHWVLLLEYLPLITLFAIIYLFKRYSGQRWANIFFRTNHAE